MKIRQKATKWPIRLAHHYGPVRLFAFTPKKMESEKWIWLSFYYKVDRLKSVDPRHNWIEEKYYSEKEWFIKKLQDDFPHK